MSIVRSPATDPRMAANILESLRLMKPADLERFGELHKSDPYMFSLAFNESNIRKKVGANAQMQSAQQPPVNEQALQGMRADASVSMPEDSGIAQLNTGDMNYADGGIVAFAGGGKPKSDPAQEFAAKYRSLAEQAGAELGVDPGLIIAQWGHETGWGRGVPGKNNLGNIKGAGTGAYDTIEKSRSQYKNYESPEAFMQDYVSQIKRNFPDAVGAGGDVGQFTKGLQKGRLGAYASDPAYAKKMASAVTKVLPMGAAQAQEAAPALTDWKKWIDKNSGLPKADGVASQADLQALRKSSNLGDKVDTAWQAAQTLSPTPDLVSQIPAGGTSGAPTPAARDDRSYFGKLADTAGIPEEYQRNISNTLSALGGFSMPTAWASKAANLASKGLEPTAEAVATAARLKQVAETPRLMPPAKAGLEALDQAAQATRAGATAARQARGLAADVQAAKGAEQSVDAATRSAQLAREMEAALRARSAATGINAAKVANVGRGVTGMQALDQALREDTGAGEAVPPMAKETFRKLEREPSEPAADITPKEAIAAAKATMTPEERKESGFTSDDWLTLGFSLLSSKSPRFMEALGGAGLATLAGKQAREKTGLEAAKTRQDIEGSKALARKYGAEAQTLEAETKTDSAQRMKAATLAQGELEKWAGLPQNFNATPAQVNAKRDELMRYYFQVLGQSGTIGAGAATGIAAPQGVKVTRVGP